MKTLDNLLFGGIVATLVGISAIYSTDARVVHADRDSSSPQEYVVSTRTNETYCAHGTFFKLRCGKPGKEISRKICNWRGTHSRHIKKYGTNHYEVTYICPDGHIYTECIKNMKGGKN